jgi:hypothetical protein
VTRINWIKSALLVAIIVFPGFPTLATQAETAAISSSNHKEAVIHSQNQESLLADELIAKARTKPRLGGRGPFCPIAPAGRLGKGMWSARPLFLWQGEARRIEVRSDDSNEVLWNQPIAVTARSIAYAGKPLQVGQTYNWMLFDDQDKPLIDDDPDKTNYPRFTLMDTQKRDLITTELAALEKPLKAAGELDGVIALQKANYFADNNLWSDVFQVVFSVKTPTAALTKVTQEIPNYFCPQH